MTTVVEDHVQRAGTIIASVDVTNVTLEEAEIDGSDTLFRGAAIHYQTRLATDDLPDMDPDGVRMCQLRLRPSSDGSWRVVDETCNASSG